MQKHLAEGVEPILPPRANLVRPVFMGKARINHGVLAAVCLEEKAGNPDHATVLMDPEEPVVEHEQ
jgi:hypothetical protein